MKFLVDVNLPPKLCSWLNARHHEAVHLSQLESLRIPDARIWELAAHRGEVIVSKDIDFYELSLLYGQPPQVLQIALGNCANDELLRRLGNAWTEIENALGRDAPLLVLRPGRLEIFETLPPEGRDRS